MKSPSIIEVPEDLDLEPRVGFETVDSRNAGSLFATGLALPEAETEVNST